MLHGWEANRIALPPTFFLLQRLGPESLRSGKEGQGLLGPRPSLAENPRARHTPAGRTLPGPGLRRRPRSRWEFEQARASGKQMPGRWARPDTHLASQKIHCQEGQATRLAGSHSPGKYPAGLVSRPTCACRRPFQEPHLAHSLALPGPLSRDAQVGLFD